MFNGKKINELEARVTVLENKVKELATTTIRQSTEIASLTDLYAKLSADVARKPKPKFNPKKNGKETPKATE